MRTAGQLAANIRYHVRMLDGCKQYREVWALDAIARESTDVDELAAALTRIRALRKLQRKIRPSLSNPFEIGDRKT